MRLAERAAWLFAAPLRLAIVVALLAALPIVLVGELAAADTIARHDAAVSDSARRAAASAAASFADRVGAISRVVSNAAIRPSTGKATPLIDALERDDQTSVQRELEDILRYADAAVLRLLVLDADARVVAVEPFLSPYTGTSLAARPYATSGVRSLEVSDAFTLRPDAQADVSGSQGAALSVGAPIGTTRALGYRLVALVRLSLLAGPTLAQLRASYKDAYLLDRTGKLALRSSRAFSPDEEVLRDLSAAVVTGGANPTDPLSPERVIRAAQRAPEVGWSVLVVDTPAAGGGDLEAALGQQRALRIGLSAVLIVGALLVGGATSTAIRRRRETAEALEQQTATADVLKTISRSAFDLQAVFDVVVENATKLCRGDWGYLFRREGDVFRLVASHGGTAALLEYERAHPTAVSDRTLIGRVALQRNVVHIPDLFEDANYDWPTNREHGVHTVLGVPIFREGEVVGAIGVARNERRPFSDADIRLVQTFADQATIAMENVRLFNETKESLNQQTALSDVLRTISRSAFDLDAVLQTIVERAAALVSAETATITRRDGDAAVVLAQFGPVLPTSPVPGTRIPLSDGTLIGRALLTGKRQYVADAIEHPDIAQGGPRARLVIPLLRDGRPIGTMAVSYRQPAPFADRDIQILETFADQAAIAIENVRLFKETREALDRQTAISEILRAIANSPADQQPVLDAIAESAARFCDAADAAVLLAREHELHVAAHHGPIPSLGSKPLMLERTAVAGRAVLERRTFHVADVLGPEGEEFPQARARVAGTGQRALLAAPLVREGAAIGAILLRKQEPIPFTPNQIQLVEAFADQAVIAIENVRLFNQTKEALERQTAMAQVLEAMSGSTTNLTTVFTAIAENAVRLCRARNSSVIQIENGFGRQVTSAGELTDIDSFKRGRGVESPIVPDRATLSGRVLLERRTVQIEDVLADPDYDKGPSGLSPTEGTRTLLGVPILHEGKVLGIILARRNTVSTFSSHEIEILETFADQAAIAIENVRLFNETKEALDRQTAVSQVLGEISQSGFELKPVLETVISHATKLCAAQQGFIYRREGDVFRLVVEHGITPEFKAYTDANPINPMGRGTITGRVVEDRQAVHIPDVLEDPEYTYWEAQRLGNFRAILGVPMMRDDSVIGVMLLWRTEPQPFTAEQIALVTTFANQATIAVENVRLFDETREALEQQSAISDVLRTISGTVFDLDPTLQTVVENAAKLADADVAWMMHSIDSKSYTWGPRYGRTPQHEAFFGERPPLFARAIEIDRTWGSIVGRVYAEARTIEVSDVADDAELLRRSPTVRATRSRSLVGVPVLSDGAVTGVIILGREAVRPFSEREVQLVETFADQAAIAIRNVRLFNEVQDKSRQLEVASRHKSEFLANMSHELRTPLNAIIGFSEVLIQGLFGEVNEKQREYLHDVIGSGQHLLSLINDILDLSKIEAGRMELELSTFSLQGALESGVTIVRERAARHGITLNVDASDEVGEFQADERKVKQIFYNLLSNAVKFTPDGGRVEVTVRRDNGGVRVEVRDNGIGIAEADQARIFEEFQQVGRERAREGTGLGLTLTKRFVELHGGRIWVDSVPGKGSTFAFTLPLRQAAAVRA